jgi:hypothetical protein
MKATLFTLATVLMLMGGKSFGMSEVVITNASGAPFYVIFNGDIFDSEGAVMTLHQVSPGRHSVDVYQYIRDPRGFYTRYVELIHRGHIQIGNRMRVMARVSSDGRMIITGRVPLGPSHTGPGQGNNSHHGGGGSSGYNSNHGGGGSSGYNHNHGASVPSPHEFQALLRTISEASFEQTKLMIAKEAVASRNITSEQVYQIMMRFSFEATRLEFAKWAYIRTVDKPNYFLVHRAFAFDSSKRELTRYISTLS